MEALQQLWAAPPRRRLNERHGRVWEEGHPPQQLAIVALCSLANLAFHLLLLQHLNLVALRDFPGLPLCDTAQQAGRVRARVVLGAQRTWRRQRC